MYSAIRNQFGSALGDSVRDASFRNAERIIDIEQAMGLCVEEWIHNTFLAWDWFIVFWNVFYGTFHFAVTIGAMVLLFVRHPELHLHAVNLCGYHRCRAGRLCVLPTDALTARQLRSVRRVRGRLRLHRHPGRSRRPVSFESGTMETISNYHAAMPSLHIAWAIWCTVALYPVLRRLGLALIAAYPVATMFAIVVTANHFWLDAVGGVIALGIGLKVAPRLTRLLPGPSGTLSHNVAPRPPRA